MIEERKKEEAEERETRKEHERFMKRQTRGNTVVVDQCFVYECLVKF